MASTALIKEHLIRAGLQFQWFSLLQSWLHTDRHGAGEVAESFKYEPPGNRKKEALDLPEAELELQCIPP